MSLFRYYYQTSAEVPHGSATFYADEAVGGRVVCNSATYSAARGGTGTLSINVGSYTVGQLESSSVFYCYEVCLAFDTSSIPSGATIATATFAAYPADVSTANAYTMRMRSVNWGATLATADYVAGADLSGYTEVANLASTSWTAGAYRTFTDVALAANVTKAGWSYFLISSSLHEAGTQPGSGQDERLALEPTTNRPRLEVTW